MAGVYDDHMPNVAGELQHLLRHGAGRWHLSERTQAPGGLGAQFLQLLPNGRRAILHRGEAGQRSTLGHQKVPVDELSQLETRHVTHQRRGQWQGLPVPGRDGAVDRDEARFRRRTQ